MLMAEQEVGAGRGAGIPDAVLAAAGGSLRWARRPRRRAECGREDFAFGFGG